MMPVSCFVFSLRVAQAAILLAKVVAYLIQKHALFVRWLWRASYTCRATTPGLIRCNWSSAQRLNAVVVCICFTCVCFLCGRVQCAYPVCVSCVGVFSL